ncbi:MAG: ABC transporter substrate-binding protein [Verrucomicrobia bacterium]|nr:ABC transporter substrate-binding protein [Verrucomicrobiota bacterium]
MRSLSRRSRSLSAYLGVFGPALIVAILGFVLAYQFVGPPPPTTITIATGSEQGAYYHFANRYATWLAQHKIELRIVKTAGSSENLMLLADDNAGVGLAFVQGGTGGGQAGLRSLGSLYYEPLWIFYRLDMSLHYLSELKGRPIAMGANFSGTRAIADLLARENGLDPETIPTANLAGTEAAAALKSGAVDAAFFVASPEAPLIRSLLADPALTVLSMDRAEAYTRRNAFLSQVHIAEGMLDLEHNIPSNTVQLISPAATLVIREDLHPALVDLVLQAAASVHSAGGMFEKPGEFPSPKLLEFPLSPEADRFYKYGPPFLQRYLPFWVATLVDRLKVLVLPLLVLLIPLFKVIPPTLRWRIRRKIIRWYKELQALDVAIDSETAPGSLDRFRDNISRIELEVTQVNVPLGYADQLYNLRLHIGLVKAKIREASSTL